MFDVEGPQGCGVSCEDAFEGCMGGLRLKGGDEAVKCPPSVKVHILVRSIYSVNFSRRCSTGNSGRIILLGVKC